MPNETQTTCPCCLKQMTTSDESCPTCGYSDRDVHSRRLQLEGEAERRIERARMLGKLFRFLRLTHLFR
ncbi:hypothetical protein [Novipirellula maiorica]|nr:hypothetical protein [Rhodopirellula maiorica]